MKIYTIILFFGILLVQDCNNRSGDHDDHTTTGNDHTTVTHDGGDSPNNNNKDGKATNMDKPREILKMAKNPCFGKCPIYSISIYSDGLVKYDGQQHIKRLGKFEKRLSSGELRSLINDLETMDFMNMEDLYPSQFPDSPKTRIVYSDKPGSAKEIIGDHSRPEVLLALDKKLVAIATAKEGWTLIEKHPDSDLPEYFIKNELLVKFNKDFDIPDYIVSQAEYDLQIKKRLAPNIDIWLLTFDTTKINPAEMLLKLKENNGIEEAEFNKQLTNRN